jgi:hypothetical protein
VLAALLAGSAGCSKEPPLQTGHASGRFLKKPTDQEKLAD